MLERVFSPKSIILNLESTEKDELFEEMVEAIVSVQPGIDRAQAIAALQEREAKMSTGIMHDIAVPHGNCMTAKTTVGAIGISRKGIEYDSLDKAPVHLVFMLLSNPAGTEEHLEVLKVLAALLQNPDFIKEVTDKQSAQEVYELLRGYESSLAG